MSIYKRVVHQSEKATRTMSAISFKVNSVEVLKSGFDDSLKLDPVEENGYVLCIFVYVVMTSVIRILQANMDGIQSKLLTTLGVVCIKFVFLVLKPFISRKLNSPIAHAKAIHPSSNERASQASLSKKRKKGAHRWHRAHMIVAIQRIEYFSLFFGNGIVILLLRTKSNILDELANDYPFECAYRNETFGLLFFGRFLLVMIEMLASLVFYCYMVRVERLPLSIPVKSKRVNAALFVFTSMMLLSYCALFMTIVHVMLCDTEIMFKHYCSSL